MADELACPYCDEESGFKCRYHEPGHFPMDERDAADFQALLRMVPVVYEHATGGLISKPFTLPEEVNHVINERVDELVREALGGAGAEKRQEAYLARQRGAEEARVLMRPHLVRLTDEVRAYREHTINLARLLRDILGATKLPESIIVEVEAAIDSLHQTQVAFGPAARDKTPQLLVDETEEGVEDRADSLAPPLA